MSSVGRFLVGEIDGKPFLLFTFLSQTDNSTTSGGESAIDEDGGDDLSPPQPLFLCPNSRYRLDNSEREKNGYRRTGDKNPHPITITPHYRSTAQEDICELPVAPLFWCNNKDANYQEFSCRGCGIPEFGADYYLCVDCGEKSHKECIESPLEIKHPSFPFLSLKLCTPPNTADTLTCICCEGPINYGMLYHCPTNNLNMHPVCALKPIPILIDHPKRHPHPLTFFPKQVSLACDVCGIIEPRIPTYVCLRCVFVVHRDCIYFPHVIRISRHGQHRISFTSSLPSGKDLSCGVCRQKVDNHCGAYSCNKCSDGYFVHARCALRRDLWDGVELEGVPEEPEIVVAPFQRIADGVILHFSHPHKLEMMNSGVYDDDKFCQACVLPIYDGKYYSCMDGCGCDFILHEICANSPLKKHHPLHARSLTLKVVTEEYDGPDGRGHYGYIGPDSRGYFICDACGRESCGFVYEDVAEYPGFRLDLRCASVSEPFEYQGHDHPLFLALTPQEEKSATCKICQKQKVEEN